MAARLARGLTIGETRRAAADLLRKGGMDTASLDVRILIGHALDLDHAQLAAQQDRVLADGETEAIAALITRRIAGEPVARILGKKEFWGLSFALSVDTLVPRPETETLVEAAIDVLARRAPSQPLRIADLGTGTGILLLALLSEYPQAWGVGTDLSPGAITTARANAARLGLAGRAGFIVGDFGAALAGGFDLVISNPPYIAREAIAGLQTEVREHDPLLALDGGPDGLDCYRAIARDAIRLLAPNGALIVELGQGQCEAVTAIMTGQGLRVSDPARNDLAGIPRALTVRPPS